MNRIQRERRLSMIQKTEQLKDLLDRGFVLYQKNGKIEAEAPPTFGSVSLHFQDGRFSYLQRSETKK